jgi:pimeloyl-ACP methyl ester carboxylesterase
LKELVFLTMYYTPHAVLLVRMLYADNRGELDAFDASVRLGKVGPGEYLSKAIDADVRSTTNVVVNCYDLARNWTDEGLAEVSTSTYSPEEKADFAIDIAEYRRTCGALPAPTIDQGRFSAPVGSNVPTLFLGGRLDATTPIEWSEADRGRFPRSNIVVAPCMGHGVSVAAPECFGSILSRFFGQLSTWSSASSLDTTCVETRCAMGSLDDDLFLEDRFAQK